MPSRRIRGRSPVTHKRWPCAVLESAPYQSPIAYPNTTSETPARRRVEQLLLTSWSIYSILHVEQLL
jgi:hypothetical protein